MNKLWYRGVGQVVVLIKQETALASLPLYIMILPDYWTNNGSCSFLCYFVDTFLLAICSRRDFDKLLSLLNKQVLSRTPDYELSDACLTLKWWVHLFDRLFLFLQIKVLFWAIGIWSGWLYVTKLQPNAFPDFHEIWYEGTLYLQRPKFIICNHIMRYLIAISRVL